MNLTITTTHCIEIHSDRLRPGRIRVTDRGTGQEWIAATREPFFAAARLFHGLGAADTDRLEMYRPGKEKPDMTGTIGGARGLTVLESNRAGPRLVKFKAYPCRGLEQDECTTFSIAYGAGTPLTGASEAYSMQPG